jgi:nucleotide-binding universal stress UspA family protein
VIAAMDLKFWSFLANPTATAWALEWTSNDLRDEDGRSWACHAVEAVAEELRSTGLSVTADVQEGDPKDVLVKQAEQWSADCIFVGAKGHRGMERFLLGSVSASVAARAHCSVEVVRQE